MSATPPGWYDDGHGARRWWDGMQWTERVQPAPLTGAAVPAPSPTAYTFVGDKQVGSANPDVMPGSAPAGVPAHGGAPGYPSVPPAAAPSRLWIVWTVLGVLALGAVITAIIVIPLVIAGLSGVAESQGGTSSDSGTSSAGSAPSEADETAAVSTVRLYDEAWQQADCDKYFASTTEAFRADMEITHCATFEENAQSFGEGTDDYVLTVTGVVQDADDVITVSTSESFSSLVDDDGTPLENPESVEDLWEYYLIDTGDGWVINGVE